MKPRALGLDVRREERVTTAGKLKLNLTDVSGSVIREDVDVVLRHTMSGRELRARLKGGRTTAIGNFPPEPDGVYSVMIDPPSYLPVSQFVAIKTSGTTSLDLTFPVDPRKVKAVKPPAFGDLSEDARRVLESSDTVLLFEGKTGATLYDAIDDVRRAGLLNIVAKTRATTFPSGRSVLSFLTKLTELRGDRFFVHVARELREETKNAVHGGLFVEAPELLHHPPEGFAQAGSYKTADHYGNLQLSFFARGDEWRADIDIDDASGLAHAFQVLRNALTNRPTHPYDIHEILLYHQRLDPGYALVV